MAAPEDVRALMERANESLDAVHDFFEHSKFVWSTFQDVVNEGRKVEAQNPATGTRVDQDGLVRLATLYTRGYLAAFTFREFVSTFEVFLFNLLYRVFLHNPWHFAKTRLEFDVVLKARDREEVISAVIAKQLNELKYESVRGWFDALDKALKLDCPTDDEIDALAEVKAARDILEHNAGVVNDTYVRKAGKKARYAVGDHVEIDDAYHLESWRLIKKVVADVTAAAGARLAPPAAPAP
jgi:hypothetical protein